jgi:carboxylesterase
MIVFTEVDQTTAENFWYRFRPQETINELNDVMKVVRKDLEAGVQLPTGTYLKEFHSA